MSHRARARSPRPARLPAAALAAVAWLAAGAGCPPEILEPPTDDDAGDDDATADDDDFTPGDDDDDFTPGDDDDDTGDVDADGDGFGPDEGDCDDNDDTVYPGADDVCDDVDNDCDGRYNEDSAGNDEYEPNDDEGYDLGDVSGLLTAVNSFLHEPYDEDRFLFYVEDGMIDWFQLDIELGSVPDDVDVALELLLVDDADHQYVGTLDTADAGGAGEGEAIAWDGAAWSDDSGTYELVVTAVDGFDCAVPYSVVIDNT